MKNQDSLSEENKKLLESLVYAAENFKMEPTPKERLFFEELNHMFARAQRAPFKILIGRDCYFDMFEKIDLMGE